MIDLLMSDQTVEMKLNQAIDRAQRDSERVTQARQNIIDARKAVDKKILR